MPARKNLDFGENELLSRPKEPMSLVSEMFKNFAFFSVFCPHDGLFKVSQLALHFQILLFSHCIGKNVMFSCELRGLSAKVLCCHLLRISIVRRTVAVWRTNQELVCHGFN